MLYFNPMWFLLNLKWVLEFIRYWSSQSKNSYVMVELIPGNKLMINASNWNLIFTEQSKAMHQVKKVI